VELVNLPDTNVWLALALSKHVFHSAARDWFGKQRGEGSIFFCRSTQQSFLRLLTTEGVLRPYGLPPMTNVAAWAIYEGFLADRRVEWAGEPSGIDARWQAFAARGTASPKLWMDAYLAAFSAVGGYRLVTSDGGFRQFQDLNPMILSKT
jgi:toxin-antitoxin system PIN domain toxin